MASFRQLKEQREARQSKGAAKAVLAPTEDVAGPSSTSADLLQDVIPEAPRPDIATEVSKVLHTVASEASRLVSLEENPDIQPIQTVDKGRGLFWSPKDGRRVGRGTTLLRLHPEVTVASSENLINLCHRCFSASKDGRALQRCSGCKVLRYCSMQCQKADWPSHRQECIALKSFQKSTSKEKGGTKQEPGTTVRLQGRLTWERKRLGDKWWKGIEALQSNREAMKLDEEMMQLPLRLAYYLGATPDEAGKGKMTDLGLPNAADVLDLISRATINSIVAYSSDLTAVGVALSTTAAMINHSCMPNVAIVYPNGPGTSQPMHVVAIRDLEPGDELTTFYVDVSDPYAQRQKILQQRYSFTCNCQLCRRASRSRLDAREALWCGRKGCSGWVSAFNGVEKSTCTICRQPRTIGPLEVESTIKEGEELLEKVNSMINEGQCAAMKTMLPDTDDASTGKWKAALSVAQSTAKRLSELQPPSAYPLLSILRQLQTACIMIATSTDLEKESLEYFEEAIKLHYVSMAGMQASNGKVYCEGHPSRAIALATLSTLLVREASPQEAEWAASLASTSSFLHRVPTIPPIGPLRDQAGISLMMQAIKELRIAYGNDEDGGEPGRKLIEQVRQWKENEALTAMARNRNN